LKIAIIQSQKFEFFELIHFPIFVGNIL